jgi:hypothetical protein
VDASLSDQFRLKRRRADIAIGAVSAVSIVVHFDVLEYCLPHLLPGAEAFAMDCFHFERMKEALSAGIVVAVTPTAHTANQAMVVQ